MRHYPEKERTEEEFRRIAGEVFEEATELHEQVIQLMEVRGIGGLLLESKAIYRALEDMEELLGSLAGASTTVTNHHYWMELFTGSKIRRDYLQPDLELAALFIKGALDLLEEYLTPPPAPMGLD